MVAKEAINTPPRVATNRIKPTLVTCPICRKRFDPLASRALPFCGERCRLIDLGRWLGEEYSVPTTKRDDEAADEVE
jgi:endogenous inhibitor of DNA gyrase (YacG/DUF329 family)